MPRSACVVGYKGYEMVEAGGDGLHTYLLGLRRYRILFQYFGCTLCRGVVWMCVCVRMEALTRHIVRIGWSSGLIKIRLGRKESVQVA